MVYAKMLHGVVVLFFGGIASPSTRVLIIISSYNSQCLVNLALIRHSLMAVEFGAERLWLNVDWFFRQHSAALFYHRFGNCKIFKL